MKKKIVVSKKKRIKLIHLIVAARPNFMKVAPLYKVLSEEKWLNSVIVHTGQHYDNDMSDVFFKDLNLPEPHIQLNVGSGTHAEQTGRVMIAYEKILMKNRPDLVVVVGDVNSTLACSLAAVKLDIKVAHLEAGLRSFDKSMPEEINRRVTDAVADYLWTPSLDADKNLYKEGISKEKITRVGNIMIDSLEMMRSKIERDRTYKLFGFVEKSYGVVTLHRPFNVDNLQVLSKIITSLERVSKDMPFIFPMHPRARKNLARLNIIKDSTINFIQPLSYVPFMSLIFNSALVVTDSGGIQEENTYLGIPCITIRPNTERPITIIQGTNILSSPAKLESDIRCALSKNHKINKPIEFWDGKTSERLVRIIVSLFSD